MAQHDYAAASSYLSIRFGESRAEKVAAELRKLPVITRRANDILRATGRAPLPLSDPGVLKDLKKVLSGQKLSPILVAEADIADGHVLTSWPSIKTDLINAGARWVDREVVEDGNLITSRKPDDLPAFADALLRQIAKGPAQRVETPRARYANGRPA